MSKKLDEMLKRFEKLEAEITSILREKNLEFDSKTQDAVVKKSLKDYIKKVSRAKVLFEEYEILAKKIADETVDDLPVLEKFEETKEISAVVKDKKSSKNAKTEKVEKKKSTQKSQSKKAEKESVNEF